MDNEFVKKNKKSAPHVKLTQFKTVEIHSKHSGKHVSVLTDLKCVCNSSEQAYIVMLGDSSLALAMFQATQPASGDDEGCRKRYEGRCQYCWKKCIPSWRLGESFAVTVRYLKGEAP